MIFREEIFENRVFLEFSADHFGAKNPPKLGQDRKIENFGKVWGIPEKLFWSIRQ